MSDLLETALASTPPSIDEQLQAALEQPELFRALVSKAEKLLHNKVGSTYQAEDLATSAWIYLKESIDQDTTLFREVKNVLGMLVSMSGSKMLHMLRDEAVYDSRYESLEGILQESYDSYDTFPCYSNTEFENQLDLETLLQMLPDDKAREIMEMHLAGYTQQEIAEDVNSSQNRVSELITSYYAFYRNNIPNEELDLFRVDGQDPIRPSDVNKIHKWKEGYYEKLKAERYSGQVQSLPATTKISSGITHWVGTNLDEQFK